MKIYAKPGESLQQFGGTCPSGWIEMKSERPIDPDKHYIARLDGTWVVDFSINLEKRRQAYIAESDSLFFEWKYDGTAASEQLWRDKVSEIKSRYPLMNPRDKE
ncbi:MAG: hypothetical protein ACRDCE_15155 [Cetobacterium sp.]|uniref:hypothetical protein n=1 Tax=Cetobacterium sp. TaxID=2071632 RepID=UPI003EE4472D